MGRSRSRTPSRKKSHRRSSSRSKHSKKSRHRTPERKSSKYRHRSVSSSDSTSRYKSSSKYQSKRRKHDSRSPSRGRKYRRSSSSSSSSQSSSSSSSSGSRDSRRSSSAEKSKSKASSHYMDKIRSMRTPTPPPSKLNFDASTQFLEKRHVSDSLAEINANEFRPKNFSSASSSKVEKSDVDVLKVKGEVRAVKTNSDDDPLFHQKVFGDDDIRMEQWVHRLYTYRQKMFPSTN